LFQASPDPAELLFKFILPITVGLLVKYEAGTVIVPPSIAAGVPKLITDPDPVVRVPVVLISGVLDVMKLMVLFCILNTPLVSVSEPVIVISDEFSVTPEALLTVREAMFPSKESGISLPVVTGAADVL